MQDCSSSRSWLWEWTFWKVPALWIAPGTQSPLPGKQFLGAPEEGAQQQLKRSTLASAELAENKWHNSDTGLERLWVAPSWILLVLRAQDAVGRSHGDVSPACPLPSSEGSQVASGSAWSLLTHVAKTVLQQTFASGPLGAGKGRVFWCSERLMGPAVGVNWSVGLEAAPHSTPRKAGTSQRVPGREELRDVFLLCPSCRFLLPLLPREGGKGTAPACPGLSLNCKPQALLRR